MAVALWALASPVQAATRMSEAQAREAVERLARRSHQAGSARFKFRADGFDEAYPVGRVYSYDYKAIADPEVVRVGGGHHQVNMGPKRFLSWTDPAAARTFADAVYVLKHGAAETGVAEIPEEARRYKVQAEAAVRAGRLQDAAEHFGRALELAPGWADGRFNHALVLGETGQPALAIREMTRYLELVPGAPDARAAQDKISEWEARLAAPSVPVVGGLRLKTGSGEPAP